MLAKYTLKVREGSRVTRSRYATAEELFAEVEQLADEISGRAAGGPVTSMFRNYEAIELVHGRIEVSMATGGFRYRRGGIDVRRDGSIEAFVGRTSRTVVEPMPGETVPQALQRELLRPINSQR